MPRRGDHRLSATALSISYLSSGAEAVLVQRQHLIRSFGAIGECQHQVKVVIRGNAIVAMHAAAKALVDNRVFAIGPDEVTGWRHERSAVTGAVARSPVVHVTGIEAAGAVIALPSA
jgi:hypothetical protein